LDEGAKARMLTDPTELATLDAYRDFRDAAPAEDVVVVVEVTPEVGTKM
jgi:hypothetical protein